MRTGDVVRVLVVEDHPIVAEGLKLAIDRNADLAVVGTVGTVAAAGPAAAVLQPHVVLLDYHLPDGNGSDAAARIRAVAPDAVLLMLTADGSDDVMLAAIEAGVSGRIVKSEAVTGIADAIRRAAAGEMLVSPATLAALLGRRRQRAERDAQRGSFRERLTPREAEILQLMARGLENRAVADQLGISVYTVRVHVQSLSSKLNAHSRLEAVVRATEYGLIDR
jgi:DNA-binding NarL/FixJ family response regulator